MDTKKRLAKAVIGLARAQKAVEECKAVIDEVLAETGESVVAVGRYRAYRIVSESRTVNLARLREKEKKLSRIVAAASGVSAERLAAAGTPVDVIEECTDVREVVKVYVREIKDH